jgi:hypothetical protein
MITLTRSNDSAQQIGQSNWSFEGDSGAFVLESNLWSQSLKIHTLATCQLWNHMEIRNEEHPVVVDQIRQVANGQELDCSVRIPFVGKVIAFVVSLQIDPDDGRLLLTIPYEKLVELQPDAASLLWLDLLPEMGSAMAGQDGYLFLPCFSGVLHRFDHDVARELRLTVYAAQPQWAMKCHFNLFGIQTLGHSFCGMITQGDHDTQLVVRSHYGLEKTYSVHSSVVYRWDHSDKIIDGDRQLTLCPTPSDQNNYNRFARIYRQWLRDERGLLTLEQKAKTRPAVNDFAKTYLLKIMMGYKKADLKGQGDYQSNTTYAQTQKILQQMREDGIDHITTQMVGWNAQGHDGRYPQRFPVNEDAGGESAMRELIQWGASQDIHIGVHDNFSDSYECGDDFDLANVIVGRDGKHWRNVPWAGGFNWRLCPLKSIEHAKRDMPRIASMGIKANYYMDAIGALTTCHSEEHPADRRTTMQGFLSIFKLAQQHFDTVSTEIAFGPYLSVTDGVYMPHGVEFAGKFTDFVENFVDEHVPALAVVLHNGIRYHLAHTLALQGRRGALMDCLWGAMPFIEIAYEHVPGAHGMPTYDDVREYVLASQELCCNELGDRISVDIQSIVQISEDLWHTTYADGKVVQTDFVSGKVTFA